jgi:hypothetical protein
VAAEYHLYDIAAAWAGKPNAGLLQKLRSAGKTVQLLRAQEHQ